MGPTKRFLSKESGISSYLIPVILILCMFASVIFIGIRQLSESEGHIHEETLSSLNLNSQIVSQQFSDMYVSIEAAAPVLAFEAGLTKEQMLRSMNALHDACGFDFVVRTNADGIAFNYLGKENIDLSGRRYIHDALQGKRACDYVDAGAYDPSNAYIILAVPIFQGDAAVGVLHGSYKVSNYDNMLRRFVEDGGSHGNDTFIVAMDGTVIAASDRNADCQPFLQVLLHEGDDADANAIASHLNADQSGYLPLTVNGSKRYYYYEPLADINCCQWVMVTTVDQASIADHTRSLKIGMALLCTVSVGITAALIYFVIRRQRLAVLQRAEAKELSKALSEAKRANSAKSDFLSRMSHDMRTPMNGILGLVSLSLNSPMSDELRENLDSIEASGRFLLSLINDILDMSKIDSDKLTLNIGVHDSEKVLAETIRITQDYAKVRNVRIALSQKGVMHCNMKMDKLRVQQIILNVLSNAVKFSPDGGTVEMELECYKRKDGVAYDRFTIRDHGVGISDEFLPKAFEPFEQEHNPGCDNCGGTGLGLSIVKRLVELMDGAIEIKSRKNFGTEVTILLHFERVPDEAAAEKTIPQEELASLAGKRILLCEDNPLNRKIAVKMLENVGCVMDCAESGQQGADRFQQSGDGYYAAVLMDILMPVLDGLAAARKIRSLDRPDAKIVPIIAMSANTFYDDIQKSKAAGMNVHLSKPVEPMQLYETLAQCINAKTSAFRTG